MDRKPRPRVLVTGASSGIGYALARRLIEEDYDLAVVARREKPLLELAAYGRERGAAVEVLTANLADRGATDRLADTVRERLAPLHGIVHNAGVAGTSPLGAARAAAFDRILELDLVSPLRLTRALLSALADGGRIVAVGSVLGRFGVPGLHAYCAAKAGIMGLVRSLALDLAPRRITVNAVLPGWVDTPMAAANIAEQAPAMEMDPVAAREFFRAAVPLGRFLEPGEVAGLVLHLLGEGGAGMTGQAINLCGGVMA